MAVLNTTLRINDPPHCSLRIKYDPGGGLMIIWVPFGVKFSLWLFLVKCNDNIMVKSSSRGGLVRLFVAQIQVE